MAKQVDKKFGWVIKDLDSFLQSEKCYSVPVLIGDCKWRLFASPKGRKEDYLSLFLEVADYQSLPSGWKRYVKFRLSIVNQLSQELSVQKEANRFFDEKDPGWGFEEILPLTKLRDKKEGFLANGEVMVIAEVDSLEVIESEETEKASKPLSKITKTSPMTQSIDVNGFQVLPSQVESVRRIFDKHPDIAVEFRVNNQHIRTTFMNFLLNVIETMCQPLEKLNNEDLVEVDIALTYLKDAGFKVGWLEKKLEEVRAKKGEEGLGLANLKEIEKQLHDLMLKCDMKKSEVLSIAAPLKFDDVV